MTINCTWNNRKDAITDARGMSQALPDRIFVAWPNYHGTAFHVADVAHFEDQGGNLGRRLPDGGVYWRNGKPASASEALRVA